MTYEELKARLTKCEVKLKEVQSQNSPARKSKNYNTAVEKLNLLKESLEKQLKEAEQGTVSTDDAADAEKLAKKGLNVNLKTEEDGVAFSKEETAAIAKQVGKAVAKSLHGLGDEVAHMKAKDLEPNSFEIYVQYKKDTSDDTFSFYISGDTLHLVDFSFDKELGGVGVKPSGEAIVHVDVLANELTKHFNAMQEGMSDQEYADAKEADRLEKHPEKDTIKKIQALIAAQQKKETDEMKHPGYKSASNQYAKRAKVSKPSPEEKERRAKEHQAFLQRLAAKNKELGLDEAPEGKSYIKVAVRDARKALAIIDDSPAYSKAVEIDGSDTYYLDDSELAYDLLMDFGAQDIEVTDNNVEGDDLDDYGRSHSGKDSHTRYTDNEFAAMTDPFRRLGFNEGEEGHHIYGRPVQINKGENSDGTDWTVTFLTDTNMAKKGKTVPLHAVLALIKPFPQGLTKEDKKEVWDEADPKDEPHSQADSPFYRENKSVDQGGDLDIGHQDDEPDMLKQYAYDIATYAAKLYKQLDKYDQMDAEVDFPNWWQSKVILAKDYISKAQHYLEFEEKQPAIDQLALEESVNESHAKLKREYDELVGKMKQLAKHFKTAEGEKKAKIVAALKQHTARKRELEGLIDQAISGMGAGQELDELFGTKLNYDEIIGGIVKRFHELKKYVSKKEPDAMDDLQQVLRAFEIFDEKMAYGAHEELEEALDPQEWYNNRHKGHREALLQWMEKDSRTKGKEVVDLDHVMNQIIDAWLKDYRFGNTMKGYLDDEKSRYGFWRAVQAQSKGELEEAEAKPIPDSILRGYNMNVKNAQTMAQALLSLFNQINDKESMDFAKHSGMKRVLAMLDKIAKTQDTETPEAEINEAKATCCGKCGRVHVKGTECKRPFLKGKDHCRYN